jgi:hypothetical protein
MNDDTRKAVSPMLEDAEWAAGGTGRWPVTAGCIIPSGVDDERHCQHGHDSPRQHTRGLRRLSCVSLLGYDGWNHPGGMSHPLSLLPPNGAQRRTGMALLVIPHGHFDLITLLLQSAHVLPVRLHVHAWRD